MTSIRSAVLALLAIAFLLTVSQEALFAQDNKRPLEHEDYEKWNSIAGQSLSRNGDWIMYTVRSGDEKSTLMFRHAKSKKQYEIKNGSGGQFTFDSQYAMFRVAPDADLLKKLKKEKRKPEEMPQVKFQILNLESGSLETVERIKSFSTPQENAEWVAIHLNKPFETKTVQETKSDVNETYEITQEGLQRPGKKKSQATNEEPSETTKKKPDVKKDPKKNADKKDDAKVGKKKNDKKKAAGTTLVLRNLTTGAEKRIPNVTSYRFSKFGALLAIATSTEKDPEGDGVTVIDLAKDSSRQIVSGLGNYRGLTFSIDEKHLAFSTDKDDYDSKTSSVSLYHWKSGQKSATQFATEESKGVPENWWIATNAGLSFSEDLSRLYFNTAPKPEDLNRDEDEKEDEEPKAKLDLWHWKDPQLQPQQLLQAAQERNRSYRAAYDLKSKKIVQLATVEMPSVSINVKSKARTAVAVTNMRYRKVMSWDFPGFQDTYLVDLKTGKATLLMETTRQGGSLSPEAKFVTWWDAEKESYFALSTEPGSEPVEISSGVPHSLADELHDTPSPVRSYGAAGWMPNDEGYLVYDRFDIWKLDPTGKAEPVCITDGFGRENSLRFRYVRTDPDALNIDPKQTMLLTAFDELTKASGCFKLNLETAEEGQSGLTKMIMLDESLGRFTKARDSDAIVFTRSTYRRFPDLWYSSLAFKKMHRISNVNPQQEEYTWGSAEMVHWDADDGQKLDGLLYKPEDFDPNKKYPLMVYFYERNSDNLHRYYAPAAGRSIINFSFYVSRGYVLFVPDIPYKTGEPGPSAANAILPGVKSIVDLGYIDEAKIGMQGHSWGGYQTAYLVTQTDMFACAESGAPVSNMTSAYGGIRWGSGMSRMFQYERTQSRIGEDLWSARDKYLANSPVFFADKINTPLLILHNDEDGAVPWYQGIELFVAMRRLEKPAWLMNYNGEPHWVMKKENRLDFAIRMQQFFDHYLMDEPMPEWMATGIPAVDKGKKFGLEPAKVQPGSEVQEAEISEE